MVARNGFKGARWRELRDMVKAMNRLMREHRDLLE